MDLPPNIGEQYAVVLVDPFLGGIGNGHLVQWSSSRGEMRPLGVPIVLGLPEDAVCQEGRAGEELVAR